MKNILYFQYPWRLWRTRLAGIYRYAASAGWNVQMVEHGLTAMSVKRSLRFWEPDGCIVERSVMEMPEFRAAEFGSLPVVYCDPDPAAMTWPALAVEHDSSSTAATAMRELLSLGFSHFAFVGNVIPRDWSDRRREAFAEAASKVGADFAVFVPVGADSISAFFARIRPWLRNLVKPCGLLAANDISGDLVLQACRMERLRVPEDIAVIGIDNDELVCEHSSPSLTSVVPDFEQSGYLAAQLLDEAMSGRVEAPCVRSFGATDVVRRNSTRKFRRRDDTVRDAIEFIRKKACSGIAPADVLNRIGGSRRHAENRFLAIVGHSIGAEIRAVRIARAKSLLLRRNVQIDSIFLECGYSDPSALRRAFKAVTGKSLREYRKSIVKPA